MKTRPGNKSIWKLINLLSEYKKEYNPNSNSQDDPARSILIQLNAYSNIARDGLIDWFSREMGKLNPEDKNRVMFRMIGALSYGAVETSGQREVSQISIIDLPHGLMPFVNAVAEWDRENSISTESAVSPLDRYIESGFEYPENQLDEALQKYTEFLVKHSDSVPSFISETPDGSPRKVEDLQRQKAVFQMLYECARGLELDSPNTDKSTQPGASTNTAQANEAQRSLYGASRRRELLKIAVLVSLPKGRVNKYKAALDQSLTAFSKHSGSTLMRKAYLAVGTIRLMLGVALGDRTMQEKGVRMIQWAKSWSAAVKTASVDSAQTQTRGPDQGESSQSNPPKVATVFQQLQHTVATQVSSASPAA